MPESVTDRPTRSHEHLFLLTKKPRYFYDAEAVRERSDWGRQNNPDWQHARAERNGNKHETNRNGKSAGFTKWEPSAGRNMRDVWRINPRPYPEAHYAVFPPELVYPCVRAGTSERGVCGACGAPWVRVLEASSVKPVDYAGKWSEADPQAGARRMLANVRARRQSGESHDNRFPAKRTVGWEPSCGCGGPEDLAPGDLEVVGTPLGERVGTDPSKKTGRAGMNRPRHPEEGRRPITRYEQRRYALQLRESPHRGAMATEAGPAFAHYTRTDKSGARPIPPVLLDAWLDRGWLESVAPPTFSPLDPVPATVLDPFAGSGTTLYAARKLGRRGVGVDLDERNAALLERRLGGQGVLL